MSYLCRNTKLFANKLGKLQLFWFFDYSFTKFQKISPILIQQNPPKILLRGLGVSNFHKKSKTKKY